MQSNKLIYKSPPTKEIRKLQNERKPGPDFDLDLKAYNENNQQETKERPLDGFWYHECFLLPFFLLFPPSFLRLIIEQDSPSRSAPPDSAPAAVGAAPYPDYSSRSSSHLDSPSHSTSGYSSRASTAVRLWQA
jgi:hypothetical protein